MTVDANIDPASTNPVENRAVSEALNGKANSNHQHGISDVNGLTQALNGKANTDHNHNDLYQPKGEYAPSDHEHSQYATNSAVQDLQEQIDLLAQGGADKKEVIAVSTYSDLTAISEPSQEVIYKTLDTNKLYLYNGRVYEDVTGVSIDNTIYVSDIAGLLTSEQEPGLYSVLVVTTTGNTTTVSATYSFAVTSVTRLLQNKDGWAERVTIGGSYQWSWHLYSYAGHNHDDAYAAKNHSHSQYLTQHQDISGKQDVITDLATIRNNATMAAVRAYTLDFGTGAELIQDVNMLGAITINRIDVLNVAHLYVTYGNVSHQEIDLTQPVSLSVADGVIITWEIVRSIEDGLACVGVRCNINPSNNA